MTIQTPNLFVAGAILEPSDLPADPFASSNGFQAFDPSSGPANQVGGFTKVDVGEYLMKLEQGLAAGEGAVQLTPNLNAFSIGFSFPYVQGGDPEEDGYSVAVLFTDVDGATPVDVGFTITVFRFNTGTTNFA